MNQPHIRLRLPLIVCILAVGSGLSGKEPKPVKPDGATGFIGKEAGQQRDDNRLKMKLVWCPPGTFVMGDYLDDDVQRDNDGIPKPDVTEPEPAVLTRGFWIGSCEVTQSEWS